LERFFIPATSLQISEFIRFDFSLRLFPDISPNFFHRLVTGLFENVVFLSFSRTLLLSFNGVKPSKFKKNFSEQHLARKVLQIHIKNQIVARPNPKEEYMELGELKVIHKGKAITKAVPKDVIVLRRMRIFRKISRKVAAESIDRGEKAIERFENGRATLTVEQKKALVRRYRYTWIEFVEFFEGQKELPELSPRYIFKPKNVPREDGRKYQKQISKEARVLRTMRNMADLSQPQAGAKCDLHRSCIDHIENGRVEITPEKIELLVRSYGFTMDQFREMKEAPLLRDEVLQDCHKILAHLDNDKLRAVKALLDNFR